MPDPNRSTKRLEFPTRLQPLPGESRNTRALQHFESFQITYAICMRPVIVFLFPSSESSQDITGGCETRCSVQLPYAEERGHHLCEARHGQLMHSSPDLPALNSVAMTRGTP